MRIVTTLPSATELVAAIGLDPVGVSHECDYPPGVESLPSVTRSRLDDTETASSGEIDQQVLDTADDEGGIYGIDTETLADLDPELIVTQGMCDVCAVDEAVVEHAIDSIDADPAIVTSDPHSVDDVFADLETLGRATGREDRAQAVRADLEARIDRVRERTADVDDDDRPRVAIFDWTDPVMVAGHWTAELVEWAGGEYGLASIGDRSRPREWDEILADDPEIVIVAPCGFDLEQTAANRSDLLDRPGWNELTAVRNDRVWALDGDQYLNRPGPRLVDTLEAIAGIVHPDRFDRPDRTVAVPFDDLDATESESEDVSTVGAGNSRTEVDSNP